MNYYFISFGTRQGNLGCVVTSAENSVDALNQATKKGLNPGGEAAIWLVDTNEAQKLGVDKLISPAQMRELGYFSSKEVAPIEKKRFMNHATIVCESCNAH